MPFSSPRILVRNALHTTFDGRIDWVRRGIPYLSTDLQQRDPETFKPLHIVSMTIRDSAEESAAAEGDVLELCKMVNNATQPLGIDGSGCDGGGSCRVVTDNDDTTSSFVAPFPDMVIVVTTKRFQHLQVSVGTLSMKVIVGSAGGGVTRKSLQFYIRLVLMDDSSMIHVSAESFINPESHRVVLLVDHNHGSSGYAIDEMAPRYSSTWKTREIVGVESISYFGFSSISIAQKYAGTFLEHDTAWGG